MVVFSESVTSCVNVPDLKITQVKVNRLQHCVSLLFSSQMNTGYVHSSGALILEPLGQQLVISVTKRGATQPITITSTTPAATVASELCHTADTVWGGGW